MRTDKASHRSFSFLFKLIGAAGLIAAMDRLFFGHGFGSTGGGFALAWLAVTLGLKPAILRRARGVVAAIAAGLCAVALLDRPTLVASVLFWTALSVAALSPRTGPLPDALVWARRLLGHALVSFAGPVADATRLMRLQSRPGLVRSLLLGAVLPVGGGLIILALFALANPLIASALGAARWLDVYFFLMSRVIDWPLAAVTVWATLRPAKRPTSMRAAPRRRQARPALFGLPVGSAITALGLFNLLFAVENGLDIAFLWSGAPLPAGVTLADYAHRGAYPLVLTALLAGGFSLLLLRKGSSTAARPLIRRLVGVWIAQNVVLTASSLLRTVEYVEAYSLTRFRLAALLWMALVMLGLVLIGWRMLRGKSAAWLVNANALALGLVLSMASVADLGAVAAWWNVRHARDLGGPGADLDVCYLQEVGPAALLPLLRVEQSGGDQVLRERAAATAQLVLDELKGQQLDWHRWTWRGARRLAAAKVLLASLPRQPDNLQKTTFCGDPPLAPPTYPVAPPRPAIQAPAASTPLTPAARP